MHGRWYFDRVHILYIFPETLGLWKRQVHWNPCQQGETLYPLKPWSPWIFGTLETLSPEAPGLETFEANDFEWPSKTLSFIINSGPTTAYSQILIPSRRVRSPIGPVSKNKIYPIGHWWTIECKGCKVGHYARTTIFWLSSYLYISLKPLDFGNANFIESPCQQGKTLYPLKPWSPWIFGTIETLSPWNPVSLGNIDPWTPFMPWG